MRKSHLSIALALAMVVGVFSALPAQAETQIPDEVTIDDPFGDANYINDQGNGGSSVNGNQVPRFGDVSDPPRDASTVADLGKIWFTHDADTITLYVQTEVPLGTNAPAYIYDVFASPGEGSVASSTFWCIRFSAIVPGVAQGQSTTWQGDPLTKVVDRCNVGSDFWADSVDGEQTIEEGPDGTGLVKMTFPRSFSPLLSDDAILTTPYARSANAFGQVGRLVSAPQVDNTVFGLDYTIGGSGGPPVVQEPPTGNEPDEPKKKDCSKKKGKAKKKCKKFNKNLGGGTPPPTGPGCAAYVPGEQGAEAETVVVKDEHTAEAPLELTIEHGMGLGGPLIAGVPPDQTSRLSSNLQLDTEGSEAGVYIRYEFPAFEDHDVYANYADGSRAAQAAGFNPIVEAAAVNEGTSIAGHSERGAEQIDGVRTADCAGYTLDLVNFLGEGGEYTVKIWLGEIQNDPQAPAA